MTQHTHSIAPEVTIDDLAIMIGKGFTETNGKIDKLDTRLSNVETRISSVETKLSSVETRISNLESDVKEIKDTMATKDDVEHLEARFDTLEKVIFKDHAPRIRRIEAKLQSA